MRLQVDAERCHGHGRCFNILPELVEADELGYAAVAAGDVPPELEAKARLVIANCPERAIALAGDSD